MGLSYNGKNSELFVNEKQLTFSLVGTFFFQAPDRNRFFPKDGSLKFFLSLNKSHKMDHGYSKLLQNSWSMLAETCN